MKKYRVRAKPHIFEKAFFDAFKLPSVSFYAIKLGKIYIPNGKIIACDPIHLEDALPFMQIFPTGRFPCELSIARVRDFGERCAFSRIVFSDKPVVKWEFALQPGQEQASIDSQTFYGYEVDSGTGVFVDEKARDAFIRWGISEAEIWSEMEEGVPLVFKFGNQTLASFFTGLGDGEYATYIGYDDGANTCRLLTDFSMVAW